MQILSVCITGSMQVPAPCRNTSCCAPGTGPGALTPRYPNLYRPQSITGCTLAGRGRGSPRPALWPRYTSFVDVCYFFLTEGHRTVQITGVFFQFADLNRNLNQVTNKQRKSILSCQMTSWKNSLDQPTELLWLKRIITKQLKIQAWWFPAENII